MKSTFSLIIALLLCSATFAGTSGADFTKQYRKGWSKNGVSGIQISNKFGEVKINNMGGDSITVKVLITIDNASDSKARDMMSRIKISLQKNGDIISGATDIEDGFRGNNSFTIDYLINTPKDKNLNITNKYGNIVLNELEAKGEFDVSYGSMTAGKMQSPAGNPVKISVAYGKADLETINAAEIDIKYSKLYAEEIKNLQLTTKYSGINLHKVGQMNLDSKYDGYSIDEIDRLKAISKYTNYKIDLLTGDLDLDTGYGSVRINKVDPKFGKIVVNNSYGGITIGLNGLNYSVDADCDYCDINYPESRYKGNKIRENHKFSIQGTVGSGGGKVNITSRYGGIKLDE
jgi:hypothetical protein